MGLELKNPIIIGASNLVTNLDNLKKLEDHGAAAIVYKSLFEEQIQLEGMEFEEEMREYNERHAEMTSLFPNLEHAGPQEHLMNLRKAKEAVSIPVIASLNCINAETWVEYAGQIEQTGVDGLELNFYETPRDFDVDGNKIVHEQIEIMEEVKAKVNIPVAVKLSQFYTNPLYVISQMDSASVDGFVLFNKLFQPDINIEKEENYYPYNISHEEDNRLALRFAGLLYGNLNAGICTSSGIFDGNDVIKMMLAGANAVQVVSTVYKNGFDQITKMLAEMESWMKAKSYKSLDDFRGKLSRKNTKDPFAYRRAQYVDILLKSEKIFKKYPLL